MPQLTAKRVDEIFRDCLADHTEGDDIVVADGVMARFAMQKDKLVEHKAEIGELLHELPDDFLQSKGGGASFLNACNDRHGSQWADLHQTMEQLFALGTVTEQAVCLMPREKWSMLPGGMPYYQVLDPVPDAPAPAGK